MNRLFDGWRIITFVLVWISFSNHSTAQRALGIDVSYYQGTVNWVNVKSSGRNFAWARATEGTTYTDSYFAGNEANAKAAGVLIGAYHFARPDLNLGTNGAVAESAYFWSVAKNYIKGNNTYMMPVLDIEYAPGTNYSKTTLSKWVNAWCSNIMTLGAASGVTVKPIVYTYISYAGSWLNSTVTNWPLWMANNYTGQNIQTGGPSSTSPWPTWKFWQYGIATVSGVSGGVDVDVFNGTASDLGPYVVGGLGDSATIASNTVPASLATNQSFSCTITFNNTGGTTWTNNGLFPYRLGSQNAQDNVIWGTNRVFLPSSTIAPGHTATFVINGKAPSTPGNYTFSWQLMQDGVHWFGDVYSSTIQVSTPVFANYDAGSAGLPALAPDPTSVDGGGWWLSNNTSGATAGFASAGLSPDPIYSDKNTWRMLDNTNASGKTIFFIRQPSSDQTTNSQWAGFRMSSYMRVADPVIGNAGTVTIYFGFGVTNFNRRFLMYLDIDTNGALVVVPQGQVTNSNIVTPDPVDALDYHHYEITYDSATRLATYWVDGSVIISNVAALTATSGSSHGAVWGTGSSSGQGDGYFNQVQCQIYERAPTVVTLNPLSANAVEGDPQTFSADFTGCATNLQWFKNNSVITGAILRAYSISNVSPGDAGTYKMGISDPQTGTVIYTADAVLKVIPQLSIQSSNANVVITFTGTLQDSASAAGPFADIVPNAVSPLILSNSLQSARFFRTHR